MHGLFTVFSVWQFVLNLTVSKPTNPWDKVGFPTPSILQSSALKNTEQSNEYDPKALFELKFLKDDLIELPIMAIADLDKLSASKEVKGLFVSPSIRGYLRYNLSTMDNFTVEWNDQFQFNYTSNLNSKGRGMELSDLKVYNGHLYAADDKTSIVFRLTNNIAVPWVIEPDGDGMNNKTAKIEWMTVKDEKLYIGGYGKEYTDVHGNWLNDNPLWVKVIDRFGQVKHVNWTRQFHEIRRSIGIEFPAYMTHESCQWSSIHQRWFFLPRRVSFQAYDEVLDSYRAGNYLITADEGFNDIKVIKIELILHPTHGFSAFQFVPGTSDTVIMALRSLELDGHPFSSFFVIFNINGSTIYMEETKTPGDYKLEGLEFVDWTKSF